MKVPKLRIENYPSKLKRVKSRNQGFIDLTVPLTENYSYKDSSQAKAWGSNFSLGELLFYLFLLSSVFLENFLLQGKED